MEIEWRHWLRENAFIININWKVWYPRNLCATGFSLSCSAHSSAIRFLLCLDSSVHFGIQPFDRSLVFCVLHFAYWLIENIYLFFRSFFVNVVNAATLAYHWHAHVRVYVHWILLFGTTQEQQHTTITKQQKRSKKHRGEAKNEKEKKRKTNTACLITWSDSSNASVLAFVTWTAPRILCVSLFLPLPSWFIQCV